MHCLPTRALRTAALAALLSPIPASAPAVAAFASDEVAVRWQRKTFAAGAWPVELSDAGRELIATWTPLAQALDYRMDLDPHLRVLCLASARHHRSVRRENDLVRGTLETFDGWMPRPEGAAPEGEASDEVLPTAQDEPPVVLVRVRDREDLRVLLAYLGERYPHLSEWVKGADEMSGFLLREPVLAAWLERCADTGGSEWQPRNELVNRLANCLAYARFGEAPHWLVQGVAWNVELEVTHSIHSFPHRDGFVGSGEHRGWGAPLRKTFRAQGGRRLSVEDLADWERDTYDDERAALAWGTVRFLVQHHSASLGPILRDLGVYHDRHAKLHREDGTWEWDPLFQPPASVQAHVLRRHLDEWFLEECSLYLQKGRRYQGKRR